ncbi:MAG: hypothetical protein H0U23_02600 [Blastocatellia bacterium]|nr:hypothetical protein [Blastocatellia bacterium]
MSNRASANIGVKPNVWCNREQETDDAIPYFLKDTIPGDLLVHFLGTRDLRPLQHELTRRQREEYEQSRFFQHHGQEGLAFEHDRSGAAETD